MVYVPHPKPQIFRCSFKQQEVMRHVLAAADKGEFIHLRGLNDLISWGPIATASLTMQIRHLEAHGFVKRLYGHDAADVKKMITCAHGEQDKMRGMRVFIVPTAFAYSFFRPRTFHSGESE